MPTLNYNPDGEVLHDFLFGPDRQNYFRGIRGPIGSGKSVACCIEIFKKSLEQEPDIDGWRKTRWAVVRATYPELRDTTIRTWLDWFPPKEWDARMVWTAPYRYHMVNQELMLDMEVIFIALPTAADIEKLKSFELTGVFYNEAKELPKAVIDEGLSRTGRYPSSSKKPDHIPSHKWPTWYGGIADTNAPEDDHWWPIMSGESPMPDYIDPAEARMLVKPEGWKFFTQPAGMIEKFNDHGQVVGYELNPNRENGMHVTSEYYNKAITGKTKSWIDVNILNRLGKLTDGKPVYPMFDEERHISKDRLKAMPEMPAYVGIDFGLTPAAVIAQREPMGRWIILKEIVATDMGTKRFAEILRIELSRMFPGKDPSNIHIYGDPAGDSRAQTDEQTAFQVLRTNGVNAYPAPTNDPTVRIETVQGILGRHNGLLIDPECRVLRKGFRSGYHYRRIQVVGEARFEEKPSKNKYSHVHDACQYLFSGAGETKDHQFGSSNKAPVIKKRKSSVWDHAKPTKRRSPFTRRSGI